MSELPGLTAVARVPRARTRCADPTCHRPVYVDQLVAGFGWCCAEKRGLVARWYRLPARPQHGPTLFDHLPEETPPMEPYPQIRIDVTGLVPGTAHAKIMEHARGMVSDPTGELAAAYPDGVTAATDDAFRGLVAILDRHAPHDLGANGIRCIRCTADQAPTGWPCDDYRDASRGLATGLPA